MKRICRRLLTLTLALGMLVSVLVSMTGCGGSSAPVLYYKSTEISEAMYSYWMSTYKTYFLNIMGGEDTETFLNTEVSVNASDGTESTQSIGDYLNGRILDIIRSNCIGLYLFDSYGLTLPDATVTAVEDNIESEIANAGGRKELNAALAPMGINISMLKKILLAEEKIDYLYVYLYGDSSIGTTGTQELTEEQYQAFYEKNYVCVKHIYIRTADKNVLDDDGNVQYDDNGQVVTAALTEEEAKEKLALCDSIVADLQAGADFDTLIDEYSEDAGRYTFTDGYVLSKSSQFPEEFVTNAFAMEIGEIRRVDASYATHIMLRVELPEKAWENELYTDMMGDMTEYVKSAAYADFIADMVSDIVYDDDLTAKYTVFSVPTTNY